MKKIEILEKRKPREKHFLQEDGTIVATVYDDDIHFLKDGKYEEINNELVKKDDYYINKNNSYKVCFKENGLNELMRIESSNHFLNIKLKEKKDTLLKTIFKPTNGIGKIKYEDILENIDIEYKALSTKVKESIIIKERKNIPSKIIFEIETDLILILQKDNKIDGIYNGKTCFTIDKPFMIDAKNKLNNNLSYKLEGQNGKYELTLFLDYDWLNNPNTTYPVIVDPTIINGGQDNNVYDTYIYPGDNDINKNNQDVLKAGVERINGQDIINRALLKFTLPTIGTGSQIIDARLVLTGYIAPANTYDYDLVKIHRVTTNWDETTAKWDYMNDKYDSKVESCFYSQRSFLYVDNTITPRISTADITNLVKKWYTDTENHGIMLMQSKEIYKNEYYPAFFSKNNNISGSNPKPLLQITYRNQNGLESYMKYIIHGFCYGNSYINTYNGNMVTSFNIGATIGGKMPANLKLIYNTNDVVLNNNIGYGIGFRLNYAETLKQVVIDEKEYLEYTDEDGTIHYFYSEKKVYDEVGNIIVLNEPNVYYDEDGLELKILNESTMYIMQDKNGIKKQFTKYNQIGKLTEIIDNSNNIISIIYDNNGRISKIIDATESEINIIYTNNTITINTSSKNIILNYISNKVTSIVDMLGTTSFLYNENGIISKITDINGKIVKYEYYNKIPYRVKRVDDCGINEESSYYLTFMYNNSSTTILDNNEKARTMVFNKFGNVTSISNLKSTEFVKDAYGFSGKYGTNYQDKNKLMSNTLPIGYVKNLISNSSFEDTNIMFSASNGLDMSLSTEFVKSGQKSLKLLNTSPSQKISSSYIVPKGNNYTFSGYIKNTNILNLKLSYINNDNSIITENKTIQPNEEFERYDVTINYPETAISNLNLEIEFNSIGICYIDDIQLETGKTANNYNYIENSDFSEGLSSWNPDASDITNGEQLEINDIFEIVTLSDGIKALKIKMDPNNQSSISQFFNISGVEGDNYTISFWYKNEGIPVDEENSYNNAVIAFGYEYGQGAFPSMPLNTNCTEWQYFTYTFIAEHDYTSISMSIFQIMNANNLYITNISLFKNVRKQYYEYDENGNIKSFRNLNENSKSYEYDKNNQLVQIITPKGIGYKHEYDKNQFDRLLSSYNESGISSKIKYDEKNNINLVQIKNTGKLDNDGLYYIRSSGTNRYMRYLYDNALMQEEEILKEKWKIEFVDDVTSNLCKISHPIILNKYITAQNNLIALTEDLGDKSTFYVIKQPNGSYLLQSIIYGKYLKVNGNNLYIETLIEGDNSFEFYFESVNNRYFTESNSIYSDDGKYLIESIDTMLNKAKYSTNETDGLITQIQMGNNRINYIYDSKKRLTDIVNIDKKIHYEYNNNNNLPSKINLGTTEYNFEYDKFLRVKNIKVGNNTLIERMYNENCNKLSSVKYGNGNQIFFEYDDFGRKVKVTKFDDQFEYIYGNNGNISKVISNDCIEKFEYDLSQRLNKYSQDEMQIEYKYDQNDNVFQKKYKIENSLNEVTKTYTPDDLIECVTFNNINKFKYEYDELGRISKKIIDDNYIIKNDYINNGKRTSLLRNSIQFGNDKLSYKFNKNNNISHVYINNNLSNKYYYNEYDELIRDDDYRRNLTIRYKYDLNSNIISVNYYKLNSYELIDKNKYEYNDTTWTDKLTRFNNKYITYDQIGNPTKIGDTITLIWNDGRRLKQYDNGSIQIKYCYNKNGIRTKKIVNNITTNYYLEKNKIVIEKTGTNMIYYLYDQVDGLLGIKYNQSVYYYLKNIQNDIIGILDSNFNIIAKYEYDSFGNIVSITDINGNDISMNNNHIANINPYRYRSYYYDKETKLYYLNNRYYNPEWGRFLNADSCIFDGKNVTTCNLFTYCNNNFINASDENGSSWKSTWKNIKNGVAGYVNNVKETIKMQYNVAKMKYNNVKRKVGNGIKNFFNGVKENFVLEVGSAKNGLNIGVELFEIDVSLKDEYVSVNQTYKDGELTCSLSRDNSISLDVLDLNDIESWEIKCDDLKDIEAIPDGYSVDKSISFSGPIYEIFGFTTSEDSVFLGVELNLAIGTDIPGIAFGGHIKIGWEIDY